MPTLLQINVTGNSGSHGKIAEEIGRLALQKGWRSIIAYGRWTNASQSELIRIGSDNDVMEHGLESRLMDNHGLASRRATKRLVQQIEAIKPDIIHLHNIHGYYLNYRILFEYLNATNIPLVWTLHDCWSFTGHCAHFVTAGCEKWKTGCSQCPLKGDYPKSFLDNSSRNYTLKRELFTANKNLHLIAVCDWLGGMVGQSFLGDMDLRIIKNGIDVNIFKPIDTRSTNRARDNRKQIVLGVSSVWNKDKGLFDFFRLREFLPSNYEIVLAGLSKKQIKGLPGRISGIERTESVMDLVHLYSQSDVFVNPTYADTFPTVNLEALACGTPVITYKTGGSPEAIDDQTGLVIEQGNVGMLATAIKMMCESTHDYSTKCRERAVQFFDMRDKYAQYFDVYDSIMGGHVR